MIMYEELDDGRERGFLSFEGPDFKDGVKVYWKLKSGEMIEGQTWLASVSFEPDWSVPRHASDLVFKAIFVDDPSANPSTKIKLNLSGGNVLSCVIGSIDDLSDDNVIEISSPDLGWCKLSYARPKNAF